MLQILFYLTTALHVSGVIIIHLQEHKTTVTTTSSGNCYTVLLSAAIVEELKLECAVGGVRRWRSRQYATHNTQQQTTTRCNGYQMP
jgi:hypothetical protein